MVTYSYPDNQTLKIIGSPPEIEPSKAGENFFIWILFTICLEIFRIDSFSTMCGLWILAILIIILISPRGTVHQKDIYIHRNGKITVEIRDNDSLVSEDTFDAGSYKFLVEETYSQREDNLLGGKPELETYRMSVVNDNRRKILLLVAKVGEYYEIMEFEEKFSEFTGRTPEFIVTSP